MLRDPCLDKDPGAFTTDVGVTGLEPAIPCSQSRCASHYATPRDEDPLYVI